MEKDRKTHGKRSATARWGNSERVFHGGFLVVPMKYLAHYAKLKLSSNEAMFILQLMSFKWDSNAPYPSYGSLARRMGVSQKMVRRYAKSLEEKGVLRRQFQVRAPNKFDLTALFEAVERMPAALK